MASLQGDERETSVANIGWIPKGLCLMDKDKTTVGVVWCPWTLAPDGSGLWVYPPKRNRPVPTPVDTLVRAAVWRPNMRVPEWWCGGLQEEILSDPRKWVVVKARSNK